MKKHLLQLLSGFLTGMLIMIIAVALLPRVIQIYSPKAGNTNMTVEKVDDNTCPAESQPITSKTSTSYTPRRDQCLTSGCYLERNETSRYCDLHDNGYRPRRTRITSYEQTRDVDDLDVEGFYLENMDEFENEGDAWDYLEDNEDEWDDY